MWTMWNAPSDRDYLEQFSFTEPDDGEAENEPQQEDPAIPEVLLVEEVNPFGEEETHVARVQEKIRPLRAGRVEDPYDTRVA